jgi:hypothetical protein
MGLMVEGKWQSDAEMGRSKGRMQRPDSILRN